MAENISQPVSADDLLKLGFEDDSLLMEDNSLCTLCSWTSSQD